MEQQSPIIFKASEFIRELFEMRLAPHLHYHTLDHTRSVAETAIKIGKGMKLGEEGLEVVTLAAWFHDTGYTELYRGHEEASVRIAMEFLQNENYPEERIQLIAGCIRATRIPQQPKNLLEKIVADADLAGLGRKSFFEQSRLLHTEWEEEFQKQYSEKKWVQQNIDLLLGHSYFTSVAQDLYTERQAENLLKLRRKLERINTSIENAESSLDEAVELENKGGIETSTQMLFKLVSNTLMMENLSADHKALIMIFANVIIIVMSLAGFVIHSHSPIIQWRIEIPLLFFPIVSGLAILYSVIALRQRTGSSRPPFFGMFYARSYDDFDKRIKEIRDGNDPFLYEVLSREYAEQRVLVTRKYRYLQLGYSIFMYGFCLAILALFIAEIFHF